MNDKERYEHIIRHYNEMLEELKIIKNEKDEKLKELLFTKAVYMDLFQIGEHVTNLSDSIKSQINASDVRGIINIRNFIGHGYVVVRKDVIKRAIEEDCPKLIARLKELFQ